MICISEKRRGGNAMIVGICDDERDIREKIEKLCKKNLKIPNIQYEQFANGEEVENADINILILDIKMPKVDGLEVKNIFEEQEKDTLIIFVTNHGELMHEAFGKNVIGFIEKSNMEEELGECLNKAMDVVLKNVYMDGKNCKDILYIKAEDVYCRVFMKDGTSFLKRISLTKMEEELRGSDLVKVHKSYIANLSYVSNIKEKELIIANTQIPVSTRMRTKVFKEIKKYQYKKSENK